MPGRARRPRTQRAHIRPVSLPGKQQHAGNKWLLCARVPNRGDVTNDHSAGQLLPRKPPTARLLRRGTRLRPRVRLPRPSSRRQRGLVGLFAVAAAAKWLSSQPNGSPRCGPRREKEPASPTETSPTVGGSVRDRLRRRRCRRGVLVCAERERVAFEVMRRWQLLGPSGPFQPQTGQSGHSEPFLATQKGSETHNKHCAH